MKIKQILTVLLTLFVVGSLAYMISGEQKTEPSYNPDEQTDVTQGQLVAPEEPSVSQQDEPDSTVSAAIDDPKKIQLVVYYFHGDIRCPTCHKLETYAKEALDTYFADEIASKEIAWKVVNVDKSENSHFIQDYKLITKSVVLSKVVEGKEINWKNLDQIWQRVGNKESYLQYICDSIRNFLEGPDL
jgi:hypothetical protein